MFLRRIALLSALLVAVVVLMAPGIAAAPGGITILGAEMHNELFTTEEITVIGSGTCTSTGIVNLQVRVTDLETGGTGASTTLTSCESLGEHIRWAVRVVTIRNRPGDRASVTATATGAINDTETKEVVIKQFH